MSAIENPLRPFYNELQIVAAEGVTLRLVLNFRTIDLLESLLGRGMDEMLQELLAPKPAHGLVGKFIWAMTREHHSDLSLDQIAAFMYSEYGPAAGAQIGELLQRVFHIGEAPQEGEQRSRPRSKSGGASKGSAASGSQRALRRRASGAKRRARS